MSETLAKLTHQIEATYRARTPRSAQLHTAARAALPGGDTRASTYFHPYPTYMARGAGYRLYDVDGNEYVDYLNNYTSLIHGHAHPVVTEAALKQVALGTAYAAPTENQAQLAALICARVPSVEMIRFGNSGTEATLNCVRAARAFTGKSKLIKMEGGYHGSHDPVEVSIAPAPDAAGPADRPRSVAQGPGIPDSILGDVVVAPFNNLDATARLIREHKADLAAVIVEPMLGASGMIPATREFLRGLRAVTRECDVLLIADEVMTFRLDYGGAQTIYDVQPDLTAFAKIIGGGFPVGAFGGRKDIMTMFSPDGGKITHSGTFNANPVTMAAGLAAMQLLTKEEIARLNTLGERLAEGLRAAFAEAGMVGQVTGLGSMLNVHLTPREVVDYRTAAASHKALGRLLHLALMNRGIFVAPRGLFNISTPMEPRVIDETIVKFTEALLELQPAVEEVAPELMAS